MIRSGYVILNTRQLRCLMYADDIFLLSDSSLGMQKSLFILEVFCKKCHLPINTGNAKVMIFNKKLSNNNDLTVGDHKIKVIKTQTYLGIEMSFSGSFKPAINRVVDKASKAYYILKQTFQFQ